MASGIIYGTTSNQYIECKIEWSSSFDIEKNRSQVSAVLYYRRTNTGFTTYGTPDFSPLHRRQSLYQNKRYSNDWHIVDKGVGESNCCLCQS